ncbi:MAG: adenosine-specific kinase [Nitrososphaerales archaeon]|nr:adenosine-specific kinase [Nitrososphaerales archaeon]
MELSVVKLEIPAGVNIILGQSHFIKTVEDLYEALITSGSAIKFGIAFCESSGPALIRHDGNDKELEDLAVNFALKLSAGHVFVITLKNAYPINVLDRVKRVDEVVNIFCATANPVEVIIAETEQGRGVLGVIDGVKIKGVETEEDKAKRREFLRKIGYKF